MGQRHGGRRAAALLVAVLVVMLVPTLAAARDTVAFTIRDSRIAESSGLARDTSAGLYWTVNDSGSGGVAYGLEPNGKVRGTLNFRAKLTDVEAVALADDRLYVADIGDNDGVRDHVTVYAFARPRANGLTVTYRSYDFRYPDGAHDAETLLVDARGRLFVVTKGLNAGVYAAPKNPSRTAVNRLTKVGSAPDLVTDGVVLPGGKRIALLTPTTVEVVDAQGYAKVASAPIPAQKQAESLAVSLDGRSLLVGSEGKDSKVYTVPIPGTAGASPTPTPSASASTDPGGQDDEPDDPGTAGSSRSGTFAALGLAGVVAVVAGLVVAFARRRPPA